MFNPGEWDIVASEPASQNVRDVLLDGVSIKADCSAVNVGRGQALCCLRAGDGSFLVANVNGKDELVMKVFTGKIAVIADGYAIANYGPVVCH